MADGSYSASPLSVRAQNLFFPVCDYHKKASTFSLLFLFHSPNFSGKQEAGRAVADSDPHPAPTQWVTVPRPYFPVSPSEEIPNKAAQGERFHFLSSSRADSLDSKLPRNKLYSQEDRKAQALNESMSTYGFSPCFCLSLTAYGCLIVAPQKPLLCTPG